MKDIEGFVLQTVEGKLPVEICPPGLHVYLRQRYADSDAALLEKANPGLKLKVVPVKVSEVLAAPPFGPDIQTGL